MTLWNWIAITGGGALSLWISYRLERFHSSRGAEGK